MEVALDENTPAEVLRELALKEKSAMLLSLYDAYPYSETMPPQYEKSKSILRSVAKNPNTLPDILKELFDFECCPIEVLNNIALSLILLENPSFLEEIYNAYPDSYKVFGMDDAPLFFQEWGVYNENISIRQRAALKIKSAFLLEVCAKDDNPRVRTYVAINEYTPGYILEKLAFDEHKEVREATAKNFNTPKNALSLLAQDKYVDVRIGVASNINTPEAILKMLAKSKPKRIRETIAANPNVSIKILEILLKDKSGSVLTKMAYNKKTPIHIIRALANKNNYSFHTNLMINSQTPRDILESLTSDEYDS
ncbi:leucine rich repeat variant (plasmid) [Calothrix sp. NIES-4071]|nr:leucine rich repeat variant [Calothrix sp. NIES-4071]BAZ64694.1 leucine rich repeat variant [Calothrix sp. NIES-4105]